MQGWGDNKEFISDNRYLWRRCLSTAEESHSKRSTPNVVHLVLLHRFLYREVRVDNTLKLLEIKSDWDSYPLNTVIRISGRGDHSKPKFVFTFIKKNYSFMVWATEKWQLYPYTFKKHMRSTWLTDIKNGVFLFQYKS